MGINRAVICVIAKNEARYIQEWIAFHKLIGFDRIYLYDNDSIDGTADLARRWGNFVTVLPWGSRPGEQMQFTAYRHFHSSFKETAEWVLFLDVDEFFNLKHCATIQEFLEARKSSSAIAVNWRLFGDNGLSGYDERLVIKRFTRAASRNFDANRHVKTLAKTAAILEPHIHSPVLKSGHWLVTPSGMPLDITGDELPMVIEHEHAQINHYFVKSYEEWTLKRQRGMATVPADNPNRCRDDGQFGWHNRNDEDDLSILRFAPALERTLERSH